MREYFYAVICSNARVPSGTAFALSGQLPDRAHFTTATPLPVHRQLLSFGLRIH